MRTWNFGKCRRTAVLFRLCLVTIVALSLVIGGISLNPRPVQALDIVPLPPNFTWPECLPQTYTFAHDGAYTGPGTVHTDYFWLWGTLPLDSTWDMNTGVLTCCPRQGSSTTFPGGVYNMWICVISMDDTGWWDIGPWHPFTITVIPPGPITPLAITPSWYSVAWEGVPFTMTLAATGCSGNYNWTTTPLPNGLAVTDPVLGIISGTPGPGTCGIYTVTVTCTDTGMCPSAGCCPPVSAPFTLIIDCWANYLPIFYYTTACDFDVEIGPGLTQGQTNVLVDGAHEATLVGGQSETFTSVPCESHLVMVDQTVQVPNSNMKFTVIGSNTKTVTDVDNYAYFDYAQQVNITTASEPLGAAQPPGAGYYAVGSYFTSTAPGTIETDIQNGKKLVFREWRLPDGTTRPTTNLGFVVNQGGTVTAAYDTFYQLRLTSDYPAIDERSFEPAGSIATWNLSLHAVPVEGGFWRFLGVTQAPVNASGQQIMNGPATVEILWRPNYIPAIIAIVITLLVIGGVVYLIYRLRSKPAAKPVATTRARKASSRTKKRASK